MKTTKTPSFGITALLILISSFSLINLLNAQLCDVFTDFSPDYTYSGTTTASTIHLTLWDQSTTAFYGKDIYISGTFIIDIPLAMNGCRVKMAPGAQIILSQSSNANFRCVGTTFFSCDQMWKGIIANPSSQILMTWSRIEDAEYAIGAYTGSHVALFQNTFNRNYISLINYLNLLPINTLNAVLWGNTFDCTAELNAPYSTLPVDTKISYCGIYLNSCSAKIGFQGFTNTFRNSVTGLYSNRSVFSTIDCVFDHMVDIGTISANSTAVGITLVNSSLYIKNCRFEDELHNIYSNYGIWSKASSIEMDKCNFQYLFHGVNSFGNIAGERTIITNCNFEDICAYGINLEMSNAYEDINNNTFIRNPIEDAFEECHDFRGIILDGINNPTTGISVSDNQFYFDAAGSYNGISIWPYGSDDITIYNNEIYYSDLDSEGSNWGIGIDVEPVSYGENLSIENNLISGYGLGGPSPEVGIKITESPSARLCGNQTDQLRTGIEVLGNCDLMDFRQNDFGIHRKGLYLHSYGIIDGVMGPQIRTANTWATEDDSYLEYPAEKVSNLPVSTSLFIIHSTLKKYYPDNVSPSNWFRPIMGTPKTCGETFVTELSRLDSLIGSFSDSIEIAGTAKSIFEFNLIYKLIRNPELESNIPDFLDSLGKSDYTFIAESESDLKDILNYTVDNNNKIDSIGNIISQILIFKKSSDTLTSSLLDSIIHKGSQILNGRTNLLDSLIYEFNNQDSILTDIKDYSKNGIEILLDTIVAYPSSDTLANLMKMVLIQKLKMLLFDSLSLYNLSTLDSISTLCLDDGGLAAIESIPFLPDTLWSKRIDGLTDRICTRATNHSFVPQFEKSENLMVSPNPISNEINLWLPLKFNGGVNISIVDVLGKCISQSFMELDNNNHILINVENINDGVYWVIVRDSHLFYEDSGKFIKLK